VNPNVRILVPVDGSEYSLRALDFAIGFASELHGEIIICNVIDLARAATMSGGEAQLVVGCLKELQTEGAAILADAADHVANRVPVSTRTAQGSPIAEIERLATEIKPSFVVIGSHGRTGLNRLVMGSVAEGVVRSSPVPVMVVPRARNGSK
jgi:nucleotide-binding universal stress UspA family protein